ncbi:MAG: Na/Pi cotransporter family protein [Acidimicrobiia bacterium]|nr:Na/Pi cotransporter family protein [Acidimicrobiia bacterium]
MKEVFSDIDLASDEQPLSLRVIRSKKDVAEAAIDGELLKLKWGSRTGKQRDVLVRATNQAGEYVDTKFYVELWEPDYWKLILTVLGGLGIFLLGMKNLSEGLQAIAGNRLRRMISIVTDNRVMATGVGLLVTMLVQSSSITTVMVVGFVNSGFMTLTQAVGVIMGANIGTTVTAQIIALDVTEYALALVAAGFGFSFFGRGDSARARGTVVMGLGLIFFGMAIMGEAMQPLRDEPAFRDAMVSLESAWLGILVGAGFTAIVQSSSATTALVIVLAGQGLIPLEAGIALILGANIGTSVTALLATIGKPRDALRAAAIHTCFNVGGVIIFLPLIGVLVAIVENIGGGLAREIANAHTIFNVVVTLIFMAFLPAFVGFVERTVKDRPEAEEQRIRAKYLDKELLRTPPLALDRARLELSRMADRVRTMLEHAIPTILGGTRSDLSALEAMDDEIDALHGHVITYLGLIGRQALTDEDSEELVGLMEATNNLEAIGDIIETNLVTLGYSRIDDGFEVSPETQSVITEFHRAVQRAFDGAMIAVTQRNQQEAHRVGAMKDEINSLERAAARHEAERLVAPEPNRVEAYRFEVDVINNLKRIYYFAKRTARAAIPPAERATT